MLPRPALCGKPSGPHQIRRACDHSPPESTSPDPRAIFSRPSQQAAHFMTVIDKAKTVCKKVGQPVPDHFADVSKMTDLASPAKVSRSVSPSPAG